MKRTTPAMKKGTRLVIINTAVNLNSVGFTMGQMLPYIVIRGSRTHDFSWCYRNLILFGHKSCNHLE